MNIPDDKELEKIYKRKKTNIEKHPPQRGEYWSFDEFKEWYKEKYSNESVCYYCKIPEKIIVKIYWDIRHTKRPQKRTKLEIERLDPFGNYNKNNTVLACFNCNNSKSDILLCKEFEPIGKIIEEIWKAIAKQNGIVY
jgi:5-methylcytosine-specific restriction endonuclease McrA